MSSCLFYLFTLFFVYMLFFVVTLPPTEIKPSFNENKIDAEMFHQSTAFQPAVISHSVVCTCNRNQRKRLGRTKPYEISSEKMGECRRLPEIPALIRRARADCGGIWVGGDSDGLIVFLRGASAKEIIFYRHQWDGEEVLHFVFMRKKFK